MALSWVLEMPFCSYCGLFEKREMNSCRNLSAGLLLLLEEVWEVLTLLLLRIVPREPMDTVLVRLEDGDIDDVACRFCGGAIFYVSKVMNLFRGSQCKIMILVYELGSILGTRYCGYTLPLLNTWTKCPTYNGYNNEYASKKITRVCYFLCS